MDALIHVDTVSSPHNVRRLRRLYEIVESNIKSLASLGVDSGSYGGLFASVLISKIPPELKLIVTRKMGDDDWDLNALMTTLEEELQARERATAVLATTAK